MLERLKTRYITIKLILDKGQFPGTGSNVKVIQTSSMTLDYGYGLTVSATITKDWGLQNCTAGITIYGLTIEDINAFQRFNIINPLNILANNVEIYAGYTIDEDGIPPLVYSGQVRTAIPDWNDPSRPFVIVSQMGIIEQNQFANTVNPPGNITLDDLFRSIISQQTGWIYRPNGVTGVAENPIYSGSTLDQLNRVCDDYGYYFKLDGTDVMVAPKGQPLLNEITTFNLYNGMIGYPKGEEFGISVKTYFNPTIRFGQRVKVESETFTAANGEWYINSMKSTLQNRGPEWNTVFKLNPFLFAPGAG